MKRLIAGLVVVLGSSIFIISPSADFNGDGTGDITIFRVTSGLWAVRGVTRLCFGGSGDAVVPGDYDGDGTDRPSIFRGGGGLWAVRGVTRVYFGGATDAAMPGDYNGDGTCDAGIFRGSSGLWAARGVTRAYFGSSGDTPITPGLTRRVPAGAGSLLKTGQTTSYHIYDDGWYENGQAFRYTDNGNGTVTDHVTGLMWAKDGNGAGCASGAMKKWNQAVDWAEHSLNGFAGYSDWRLPNWRELESLTDAGRYEPAIDPIFINTKSEEYWSSSTFSYDTSKAWFVEFGNGEVYVWDKTDYSLGYVRAVRGGE